MMAQFPHKSLIRCSYQSEDATYIASLFKIPVEYSRPIFSYKPIISNTVVLPRSNRLHSSRMLNMLDQRFSRNTE
jgi:hypothetical protein